MTGFSGQDTPLAEIRREIDEIDDGLIELLEQRFAATERVRLAKSSAATVLPIRPAREAEILRRLVKRAEGQLSSDLVLRIWRAILSASTLAQAPLTIHVSRRLNSSVGLRLRIRDHFGPAAVEECKDEGQALLQVNAAPGDLCIVEPDSSWVEPFLEGQGGRAQVIGVLPVLRDEETPKLLIFGNARAEATGDDQTLIITDGQLPRDFAPKPVWQIKAGNRRMSCLPGFLSEHESPLVGLGRSNATLGIKVVGNFPSPMGLRS
ncbi:MAG: chorismate mutase [Aestuariivirga sp.]